MKCISLRFIVVRIVENVPSITFLLYASMQIYGLIGMVPFSIISNKALFLLTPIVYYINYSRNGEMCQRYNISTSHIIYTCRYCWGSTIVRVWYYQTFYHHDSMIKLSSTLLPGFVRTVNAISSFFLERSYDYVPCIRLSC